MQTKKENTKSSAPKKEFRDLVLQKEISKKGEDFGVPEFCKIEYPLASIHADSILKYHYFIVHITVPNKVGSLYEGGTFRMEVDLRDVPEYPNRPPKCKMLTKVFHVNINDKGAICHNYLKVDGDEHAGWTPVLGLSNLILGVSNLLFDGSNPDDPLNVDAADLYKSSKMEYEKKVKEWVKLYAQEKLQVPKHHWASGHDKKSEMNISD